MNRTRPRQNGWARDESYYNRPIGKEPESGGVRIAPPGRRSHTIRLPGRRSPVAVRPSRALTTTPDGFRQLLSLDRSPRGAPVTAPRPQAHHWQPDDAGARVSQEGMHRTQAQSRERAADLHSRGSATLLDRGRWKRDLSLIHISEPTRL